MNPSSSTTSHNEKIKRVVEKSIKDEGLSPMSPPDYFNPPSKIEKTNFEELPPSIQTLIKEHQNALHYLQQFEETLQAFKENNFSYNAQTSSAFKTFFEFFDTSLLPHHQKESKYLFPILEKYLIKSGEHNRYMNHHQYHTPVDLMEDDHLKILQAGSLIFNLLGIFVRIPDPTSRLIIADIIFNKGTELIDLLRIHIYQEENILFPQSAKYLTKEEFEYINKHIV